MIESEVCLATPEVVVNLRGNAGRAIGIVDPVLGLITCLTRWGLSVYLRDED